MGTSTVAAVLAPLALLSGLQGRAGEGADLAAIYDDGQSFADFLAGVDKRGAEWRDVYANAEVAPDLLERVGALPGRWHVLVVAADWCGDSVHTIPYLARLVERSGNLELAIVDRARGDALMRARRTPDGRAATPTVVLLDGERRDAGCWLERPSRLQQWVLANEGAMGREELLRRKYDWYREERGRETLSELVAGLEAAAAGSPDCAGLQPESPR